MFAVFSNSMGIEWEADVSERVYRRGSGPWHSKGVGLEVIKAASVDPQEFS